MLLNSSPRYIRRRIAGQGAAELLALDEGAERILGRQIAGFEDDGGARRVVQQLGEHHDQRLAGVAHPHDALVTEKRGCLGLDGEQPRTGGRLVCQHLKLHASFGSGGLVERAGGDEFIAGNEIGGEANFEHGRSADAETGSFHSGTIRMFAEQDRIQTNLSRSSRRESALIV